MAFNVTFRVDMAEVTDPFTTPEVNGDFNGWCGGCAPMTNIGGSVWELTIDLAPGVYEYKFAADGWAIQENLTEGTSCTVTNFGFTNRSLTVVDQDIDLGTVCWASCQACGVAPVVYDVTFRVDMAEVTDPYTTPEVNGEFNGWCGGCAPMTNVGGSVWEITIPLEPGSYEYKFAADTWTIQENLTPGSACTVTNSGFTNRVVNVVDQNVDLGTVCWASCEACGVAPTLYNVTFQVDMADVTDPYTTPEVNGMFNGWCGGCAPMTNVGGSVWEITIPLEAGSYEYKFAADGWAIQENLTEGSACTVTNNGFTNRLVTVVDSDITLPAVCWASCEACVNDPGPGGCTLNFGLTFDDASSASAWQAVADATLPEASLGWNAAGQATGALELSGTNTVDGIGRAYIFQYVDGAFDYAGATSVTLSFDLKLASPLVGAAFHLQTEFPGVGTTNTFDLQTQGLNETTWTNYTYTFNGVGAGSLFRMHFNIAAGAFIGAGGTVLVDNIQLVCNGGTSGTPGCTDTDAVNYDAAATSDDGSCQYNVTFYVDMANVTDPYTTPEVNGTFNGFCGGCAPMTNIGGTVWEITIPLPAGFYEYKFAADTWTIQENLVPGSSCTITTGPFTNRALTVTDAPIVLDQVCWGSCQACTVAPQVYNVTFRVDMANVTDPYTTPEVNGMFNGWCGGCAPMTNVGGSVWEITIPLEAGSYEYKFAADGWAIQENLTEGSACTVTNNGFTNRLVTVVDSDITLPAVCWASCEACAAQQTYNVTFRVDMANVVDPYTTPEVNGTFNGFCGGCAPMTNVGGSVWEITIPLAAGSYEYKFAADTWTIQEELTPGSSCTVTNFGFTNRFIEVIDQDIDLGTVCWASCQACDIAPQVYNVTFRVDMANVTDPYTTPEVNGTFNGFCGGCAPMTNIGGTVWEITIPLEAGSYEYKFAADTWTIQENLVPGAPCTVTNFGFTNRFIEVIDQDLDLGTVCWASCQACDVAPQVYNVTFRVDMANVTDAYTTPEVNGTFNGFCGGCAPMTNIGGTVWEITIPLEVGFYEYKFAADTWNIQENLTPGSSCTITTDIFTNRFVEVIDQDIDMGVVCWAECVACAVPGAGCTYPGADNYDAAATTDDGSCIFAGCTDPTALNYQPYTNFDNGSCLFEVASCPGDFNNDGAINVTDLSGFLAAFGSFCE